MLYLADPPPDDMPGDPRIVDATTAFLMGLGYPVDKARGIAIIWAGQLPAEPPELAEVISRALDPRLHRGAL